MGGIMLKRTKAACMLSVSLLLLLLLARNVVIDKDGGVKKGNKTELESEMSSRKLIGTECSKEDIRVDQQQVAPLPNGIPQYAVQISNMCRTDCNIANIHLHCGMFSSVRLINPTVFRRLRIDDCLVNNGQPLAVGKIISFTYANTFSYPLSVASVVCPK